MGVIVRKVLRDLDLKNKKPKQKIEPQYDWQRENNALGNITK